MNQDTEHPAWYRNPEIWVALLTLLVRFWFLMRLQDSPFFVPIPGGNDRSLYNGLAQNIAKGHIFPEGVFAYMPLYPWCLGLLYAIVGSTPEANICAAGLVGAMLDAATTFMIVRLARRLGASPYVASAMGILYALYPTAIIYSTTIMPNTLNAFLLMTFVVATRTLGTSPSRLRWFGAGLLAGVIALGFAGMLLILMICLANWAVCQVRRRAFNPLNLVCCLAGMALPIFPATLHNWRAEHQFVLVTAHGGFNFYMGNNPDATGYPIQISTFRGDAGSLLVDARAEAERIEGRKLTAAEFSAHWSDRAWKYIRENPGAEGRLLGLKFLKFWNRVDYDDMRFEPMLRLSDVAFTWPTWPGFVWIAWLGFAGLVLARGAGWLKLVVLSGLIGVIGFFITARYRLTFAPLLCVLGALGIHELIVVFCDPARARLKVIGTALVFVVTGAIAFLPLSQTDFRALDHLNTAAYLMERKMPAMALEQAISGIRISPYNAELRFVEGNAFMGLRQPKDAVAAYAAALEIKPSHAPAHFNMAQAWMELNEPQNAAAEALLALKNDPKHPHAWEVLEEARQRMQKINP